MVILVVASVPVAFLNMLNQFAPLILLNHGEHLSAFSPAQTQALAIIFLDLYEYGIFIAEIFWGLWLFPFGLLVYKAGFFPKWLGVLLLMGGLGYLVESLIMLTLPAYRTLSYPGIAISAIAEISFILWVLFNGVTDPMQPHSD